jgi:hypothetical protein
VILSLIGRFWNPFDANSVAKSAFSLVSPTRFDDADSNVVDGLAGADGDV